MLVGTCGRAFTTSRAGRRIPFPMNQGCGAMQIPPGQLVCDRCWRFSILRIQNALRDSLQWALSLLSWWSSVLISASGSACNKGSGSASSKSYEIIATARDGIGTLQRFIKLVPQKNLSKNKAPVSISTTRLSTAPNRGRIMQVTELTNSIILPMTWAWVSDADQMDTLCVGWIQLCHLIGINEAQIRWGPALVSKTLIDGLKCLIWFWNTCGLYNSILE